MSAAELVDVEPRRVVEAERVRVVARVDALRDSVVAPARCEQQAVCRALVFEVLVEPGDGVPVADVRAAKRGAEGLVGDVTEVEMRAAADDDLARVDAGLAVAQRP